MALPLMMGLVLLLWEQVMMGQLLGMVRDREQLHVELTGRVAVVAVFPVLGQLCRATDAWE
jgi:hypothetical protein